MLQAQGRREFDDVVGSGRRGHGEVDVVAGSGTASRARGRGLHYRRRHRIGSGKMATRKGLDRGWG
jgi:hypothetical protein